MEPYEIKPSIVKFYELIGEEASGKKCLNPDFWGVAFKFGDGKAPPELAQALRECLHDFPSAQGVHPAAKMLLWQGYDFPDIIPLLSGWDQLMYKWKAEGITLEKARELLKPAGFDHAISLEASNQLAKWIENPTDVLERYSSIHATIASTLFGSHCVEPYQNLDEDPPIAEMFLKLYNAAGFSDKITEIKQEWENGEYDRMIVHFLLGKQTYKFGITMAPCCNFTEKAMLDEELINFDTFLANIGKSERIFNLNIPIDYPEQVGWFVLAEPDSFSKLCEALHIPASRVQMDIQPTLRVSQDFKYPVPLPDIITGNAIITPDNLDRYKNIVEAQWLEIHCECELPNLTRVEALTIQYGKGNIILPKLSLIEGNLWAGSNGFNIVAESLRSIGGNLSASARTMNLPCLQSIGGKLQIWGYPNATAYFNAPELESVREVDEDIMNAVLNIPKLRKLAGPVCTSPELKRNFWSLKLPG